MLGPNGAGKTTTLRMLLGLAATTAGTATIGALYDLYHQAWLLGAPVIAPAVASRVMLTPAPAFPHGPPQWAGAVIMAGYALALAAAGVIQTRRHDIATSRAPG